jgi:hypothetical protein
MIRESKMETTDQETTDQETAAHDDMSKFVVGIHGKPYMMVAGRVGLMHQEADKQGEDISIETDLAEFAGTYFCVAKVKIGRKQAVARASVHLNAESGPEVTSPYECAETSAVGRALGFLGYGDVSGIASADEVISAQSRQNGTRTTPDMTQPPMYNVERPPSDKQVNFIRKLARDMDWAAGETEAFISTTRTMDQAKTAIDKMLKQQDPRPNRPGGQERRDETSAYGDDDIPTDDDDPEPGRPEMDAATRKAFFAELSKVSRWKEDYQSYVRAYIQGEGWGTPQNPGTTKYLTHMQRQAVLKFVADLEGPGWTDLFGDDCLQPETPWFALVKWYDGCKLEAWDVAMYLMAEFGDKAPGAKRPADFPPELVAAIGKTIEKAGEIVLDDIKDHAAIVRAF